MRISDWSSDVCSSDLTTMRQVGIETPVLMISALSDIDERVRGLRAGGDDYMTKPFAPDELAARVGVLLRDRKSVVSGKSVSVRVDLGGRRTIRKKTVSRRN